MLWDLWYINHRRISLQVEMPIFKNSPDFCNEIYMKVMRQLRACAWLYLPGPPEWIEPCIAVARR
jgi:hypothetical protein